MRPSRSRRIRITVAAAIAGLATALTVAATAAPASATASSIHAKYKVTGSTFLKAPNATLPLGPGKLAANLDASTGNITATLTMPDATLSFKQFGLIPVTATTHFINSGPTTGTLNLSTGAVTTTSNLTFQIVSLSVAGIPVPVGPASGGRPREPGRRGVPGGRPHGPGPQGAVTKERGPGPAGVSGGSSPRASSAGPGPSQQLGSAVDAKEAWHGGSAGI